MPGKHHDLNPDGISHAGAPDIAPRSGRAVVEQAREGAGAVAAGHFGYEPRNRPARRQEPHAGPECPECGSTKTPVRVSGKDLDARPARDRQCGDCGFRGVTVEEWVPGARFIDIDVERKRISRENWRKRHGVTNFRPLRAVPVHRVLMRIRTSKRREHAG